RRVTGRVVGDDSRYDQQRGVDGWPSRYLAQGHIGSLGALTVDDGLARFAPEAQPYADAAAGAAAVLAAELRARGVAVVAGGERGPAPAAPVELASVDSPTVGELVA